MAPIQLKMPKQIISELEKYSPKLAQKPRWLVFNKIDLLLPEEAEALAAKIAKALDWEGDYYKMSAFQKLETQPLCRKVMDFLHSLPTETEVEEEQPEVDFKWDTYHKNTLEQAQLSEEDDDWDDEDDDHPNIVYTNE